MAANSQTPIDAENRAEIETDARDLTDAEIRHIAQTLEAEAKDWEEKGRDGYAFRERELAARLRGERDEPVMEDC